MFHAEKTIMQSFTAAAIAGSKWTMFPSINTNLITEFMRDTLILRSSARESVTHAMQNCYPTASVNPVILRNTMRCMSI